MRLASSRSQTGFCKRAVQRARALALCGAVLLGAGCAGRHGLQALPQRALLAASEQPGLFLGAQPDAAQIGYIGPQVVLELTGEPAQGRVPVRIEGPLRARGYVAVEQLVLQVQRRGRVRGAPVYVGPGDLVHVLGPAEATGRLRVRAVPRLAGQLLPSYEGSFPSEGLAASAAPSTAVAPEPGTRHRVPAHTALPLFEAPNAAPVATLAPQPQDYEVRVVGAADGWLAVRAGDGPYLIGWTQTALLPALPGVGASSTRAPQPAPDSRVATTTDAIPARLIDESGELKRVVAGAQLQFGSHVIGVFKRTGWARVLRVYDAGVADVFVAVDDDLALRGLLRTVDLVAAPAPQGTNVSEISTPAAAR